MGSLEQSFLLSNLLIVMGQGMRPAGDKPQVSRLSHSCHSLLLVAAMPFGCAVQAMAADYQRPIADDQRPIADQVKNKKVAREAKVKNAAEADKRTPAHTPVPPMDSEQATIAKLAAIQKRLGWKGWSSNVPVFQDSLLMDIGGWRSKLAEAGIGFLAYQGFVFADNMLKAPRGNPDGSQAFWGQKPSAYSSTWAVLTIDTGTVFGIPGGQIQIAPDFYRSTMQAYFADAVTLSAAYWRQNIFNGQGVVAFGLMNLAQDIVGASIGGSLFSPFGTQTSVAPTHGAANSPINQPAVEVTWNFTDKIYTIGAVGRGSNPAGTLADLANNPAQVNPFPSGTGEHTVALNEWGYKQQSGLNTPYVWARVGGIYSNSSYTDFTELATKGSTDTKAMWALVDYQISQFEPTSPAAAYRGMYVGASFNYGPPESTLFTKYYEARFYIKGPWESRPGDQFSLSYSHIDVSKDYVNYIDGLSPLTGTFAPAGVNNVTATYTARLRPGVYLTGGVGYTDKPAISYRQDTGSAFNFLSSLSLVF
jgi:porin